MKKTGLNRHVYNFSIDYRAFDTSNIIDTHKYLMKKLALIKIIFMRLLISIVNASNHTKCVSLSNQKCEIQPTFISLDPNFKNFTIIHLSLN